jgi:hypothetical protein
MGKRSHERSPIHTLLQYAAQGREDLTLASFEESHIQWAIETGLGPLLFRTTRASSHTATSPFWPLLQSAHLVGQVLTAAILEAMEEIIDACTGSVSSITLLKGISLCEQYYPAPHLRPMRDIDFLVDAVELPKVEALLFQLGYHQPAGSSTAFYATHHHSMPFHHPQKGVWIEVHRGLATQREKDRVGAIFSLETIKTQLQPSVFRGRSVTRLSAELQVPYIASHWATGFKTVGGVIALLDLIYLLKHTKDTLDWERILHWVQGSAAASHLSLLLTYLSHYQLVDIAPEILSALSLWQRSLRRMNRRILHALIDRYLVEGHPCGGVQSLRNLDILWRALLLPGSPSRNLLSIPLFLLLPLRLRKRLL